MEKHKNSFSGITSLVGEVISFLEERGAFITSRDKITIERAEDDAYLATVTIAIPPPAKDEKAPV